MEDETILIIGAVAVGAYFLKDALKPVGEGAGSLLGLPGEVYHDISGLWQQAGDTANTAAQAWKANTERNTVIAAGERTAVTANFRDTGVLYAASKVAANPTPNNISYLRAAQGVLQAQTPKYLGGQGLLTPGLLNLGSSPIKTQQLSTYSKIDKFLGGVLPGGVSPFWK